MSSTDLDEKKSTELIKVVVRCRPMNNKEAVAKYQNIIYVGTSKNTITISNGKQPKPRENTFTFDAVYGPDASQDLVFKNSVLPLVTAVLEGYNATVFAYGQTGTGKTYTMEGTGNSGAERGIIPRTFEQIFHSIHLDEENIIQCSYLEIYQEKVTDLLTDSNQICQMVVDEQNMVIKNLSSFECPDVETMHSILSYGNHKRKTGSTEMNQKSSRSHAVFIIYVKTLINKYGIKQIKYGKLNLVDLAGSERQQKSNSSGQLFKEATQINLSLIALGKVLSALTLGQKHIPYRDSKLTLLLRDSLGGNAKTLMIANIGPSCYNYTESLNTLQYANRAKYIKNDPTVNEDLLADDLIPELTLHMLQDNPNQNETTHLQDPEMVILTKQKAHLKQVMEFEKRLEQLIKLEKTGTKYWYVLALKRCSKHLEAVNISYETYLKLKEEKLWTEENTPGIGEYIEICFELRKQAISKYNTVVRTFIPEEYQIEFLYNDSDESGFCYMDNNERKISNKDRNNRCQSEFSYGSEFSYRSSNNLKNDSPKSKELQVGHKCTDKCKVWLPYVTEPYFQGLKHNRKGRLSRFRDDIVSIPNIYGFQDYYLSEVPLPESPRITSEYIDSLYKQGKLRKLYKKFDQ